MTVKFLWRAADFRNASTVLDLPIVRIISLWKHVSLNGYGRNVLNGASLGMDVILCVLRNIIVYSLKLVKNVLNCLHEYRFQPFCKGVWVVWFVLLQGAFAFRL